jgi:VIT1/CCC1 family predicted Fe2+/Mn2+ transporter
MRQHDCQSIEQRRRTFEVYHHTETEMYNLLYDENWELLPFAADSPVISRKLSGSYEPNTLTHFFHTIDQRKKSLRDMVRRFGIAILGGVALIVPMLVMTLHKSRNTGIITASLATFVFAAFVAAFSNAQGHQLLNAVAAYAAVLVVFVGASG